LRRPLVSILTVAYNHEKYIAQSIESVLASTYTNFELIVVDDVSKDNTVAIARKYEEKDSRVKVYVNESNLGDYPNRNKAASYAKGEYIKYVDGDDLIYPWGLEILVSGMEAFPDAGWGLCSLEQDEKRIFPFKLTPKEIYEYAYLGPGLFHKSPLSSIIRTDVFEKIGRFTGKKYLGDFEFWHLLGLEYDLVLMPHGMVWHRIHDQQLSKFLRTDPSVDFKYNVSAQNFFRSNNKIPLDQLQKNKALKKLKFEAYRRIIHYAVRMRFRVVLKLFKMLGDPKFNIGYL
jgi:glycosyltransferase involved in cell wall biosynthesis